MNTLSHIIESYINGNITLSRNYILKIKIKGIDIHNTCECFGIDKTITILKKLNVLDLPILNAFHDYDRSNYDYVENLLQDIRYNMY